jgi:phage shock protein A
MTDHDKTIGRLEAHVDDLRADVRAMRQDVQELKDLVQQARGARAALAALSAAFGGAGAMVAAWFVGIVRGG